MYKTTIENIQQQSLRRNHLNFTKRSPIEVHDSSDCRNIKSALIRIMIFTKKVLCAYHVYQIFRFYVCSHIYIFAIEQKLEHCFNIYTNH